MGKDIKIFYELNTIAKLTNKKEQWEALRELLPIEYMKVIKGHTKQTKYGLYNNYRVVLKAGGNVYGTVFHDTIANYNKHRRSADVEIFACLFMDAQGANSVTDLQDFCKNFGYKEKDLRKAQKAYEGCKEAKKFFDKVFDEYQQDVMAELLEEWGY